LEEWQGHTIWRILAKTRVDPVEHLEHESADESLRPIFQKVLDEYQPDVVHVFHFMYLTTILAEEVISRHIPLYFTMTDYWLLCPTYQLLKWDGELCKQVASDRCLSCQASQLSRSTGWKRKRLIQLCRVMPRMASYLHGDFRDCKGILNRRLAQHSRFINESATGVFFPSLFSQQMFHSNNMRNNNETVLPFPLPSRAEELRTLPDAPVSEKLRITFVGTLSPSKGVEILLRSCSLLKDRANLQLNIWGKAKSLEYDAYLRSLVSGIDWIEFCGTFPQEEFSQVLKNTDVVVIPSTWYENTPLTALSALAAGKTLVISDVGGLSDLTQQGEAVYLFPVGDSHALAAILRKLAEEQRTSKRTSLRNKQPLRVSEYVEVMLKTYERSKGANA